LSLEYRWHRSAQVFFAARAAAEPHAPAWVCPRHPLYLDGKAKPKVLAKDAPPAFGDAAIDKAFALYLAGNPGAAVLGLQKVQENTQSASVHATARGLQRDIVAVDGQMKTGQTQIAQGKLEAAAKAFDEALALDAKMVTSGPPSALRKQMQADLAQAAYERGQPALARGDNNKAACRTLKLGYRFSKANQELLQAVTQCTGHAAAALASAKDCAALDEAIELSVEGDAIKDKAEIAKRHMNCP
jgi:hypothetical protein